MFMAIVNFPPVKQGKEQDFFDWFEWSNQGFAGHKGFIRRCLLKAMTGDEYAAIVEHESHDTFMAMNNSAFHKEAGKRIQPLFDGVPKPHFYEVIRE